MAIAVTPKEWRAIEVLFRYFRTWTPNVLTIPWETRTAAQIPIVFGAVGTYEDLMVAVTEMRPARPKEIPVVTAT